MNSKKTIFVALTVLLLGFISLSANATIFLTPNTVGVIPGNLGGANCEPGCVYSTFNINGGINDGSLSLLYKADVGGGDTGTFAASYDTAFANTSNDPQDALITNVGNPTISCPDCYLAIKDGNQNPSYYFYNLSGWDGVMNIDMTGFWPGNGAISHVSIWGVPGTPPIKISAPGILILLAAGLFGLGLSRKRIA